MKAAEVAFSRAAFLLEKIRSSLAGKIVQMGIFLIPAAFLLKIIFTTEDKIRK